MRACSQTEERACILNSCADVPPEDARLGRLCPP